MNSTDDIIFYNGRHTGEEIDNLLDRDKNGELTNVTVVDGYVRIYDALTKETYVLSGARKLVTPASVEFGQAAGFYNKEVTINLSCTTPDVTIYYTIDGSDPTNSVSRQMGSSVKLLQNTTMINTPYTLSAVAFRDGVYGSINQAVYNIYRQVATPTISVSGNIYSKTRTVTISCSTPDANIYYSTDGGVTVKSGNSFTISSTVSPNMITAFATKNDWIDSTVYICTSSIVVGALKMQWDVVTDIPFDDAGVIALNNIIEANTFPRTISISSGFGKVCFAYPQSLGKLTSIKDSNGVDYTTDFIRTTTPTYYVYTMADPADQSSMTYIFSK